MGTQEFIVYVSAPTAKDAFRIAVEEARYEHGAGGYTGTIAEKSEFTLMANFGNGDPEALVDSLLEKEDQRVCDKWGPCGCVKISKDHYLFFGMASS